MITLFVIILIVHVYDHPVFMHILCKHCITGLWTTVLYIVYVDINKLKLNWIFCFKYMFNHSCNIDSQ